MKIENLEKNTYNEMVYKSNPFSYSSPLTLEACGTLFCLEPASSTKNSRILELGCSFGGNIITQALYYPDNYYVGVDLTEEQINTGKKMIEKMGLKNIELHQKDIMEIDESFGKFDYIITHGVFSWIPDAVKDKMISICDTNLNENGLAYISYNTLPGWKEGQKIRDMMLYVNKYFKDESLQTKTERGKVFLEIMIEQMKLYTDISEKKKEFIALMEKVLKMQNYYVGHEYLEAINDPMYFSEFAEMLEKKGLIHVSDINLRLSFASIYKKETKDRIEQLSGGNHIIKEQCIDFILDTQFRKSLICKKSQAEKLNFTESINNEIFDKFYYIPEYSEQEINNFPEVSELTKKLLEEKNIFQVSVVKDFYKEKGLSDEEIEEKLKKFRAFLLVNMIDGKVSYYCSNFEKVKFEENKVYVPEKFIKYLDTIVDESNTFIGASNYRNQLINGLNAIDVIVIKALKEPTTKKNLLEALKDVPIYRHTDEGSFEVPAEEYLEEALKKFENLHYFVKK